MENKPQTVTQLLREWHGGNKQALNQLTPLIYDELRRLAKRYMRRERSDHTLQPTALVHEAFMRLVDEDVPWQNRAHFFAIAAQTMRRILVEHARRGKRPKRGGRADKRSLDETVDISGGPSPTVVALDEALNALTLLDAEQSRIVELKYFGGLTAKEIGEVLDLTKKQVDRRLSLAKAWLARELSKDGSDDD